MKSFLVGKTGPIILFIALMALSHLMLPAMGRDQWGPFSSWNLFSSFRGEPSFDLVLKRGEREFFLSDGETFDAKYRMSKFLFWYLTQGFSELTPPKSPEGSQIIDTLNRVLKENQIELRGICRMRTNLAEHLLMSAKQKRDSCESVYP